MCFSHFASSIALANGINPEDTSPISGIDLTVLQEYMNWQLPKHSSSKELIKSKTSPP